ncbi:MAG TPA: hypothetical protein VN778_04065, partial [Verrucomicrobiae bacterium]|nr:hypothetical protein [Verrucomicrobiae bacterium]
SSLVTWVESDDTELAIVTSDQFKDFQRARSKTRVPGRSFNWALRALNPSSAPTQRLQQRQDLGQYDLAQTSDYSYADNNIARGLIVDTLPMLVSGLRTGELRIGRAGDEVVRDLGTYCLALFADRQPVSLVSAV